MIVIYAEKPDMGEKIASALGGKTFQKSDKKKGSYSIKWNGEDCEVTWGYGHLCCLADASGYKEAYKNWKNIPFPFFPEEYKIVLNERSKMPVRDAVKVCRDLFKKAEYIINATDFDREGELIFYYLYTYLGCRKKVKRVNLSGTTPKMIQDAFSNLMDSSDVEGILEAARCRSIDDWVTGCNLTALMTLKTGGKEIVSVGRVQTAVLDMVVSRDVEIEDFKPKDYFAIEGMFQTSDVSTYKGTHTKKRFDTEDEARAILDKCRGLSGFVSKVEKTTKSKLVPGLYSLSALQMDANAKHGISLQDTLNTVQSLYEKGYVSYPRTDSQFLPEGMFDALWDIQQSLAVHGYGALFNQDADQSNMMKNKRRFFDDSKVGSHYAIIPTDKVLDPSDVSSREKKIYDLIVYSVIRMLYPDALINSTKIVTTVNGEDFVSTGSSIEKHGWLVVGGDKKEDMLPNVERGDEVSTDIKMLKKQTEPPKRYTDKTLLSAMLSAGKNIEEEELRKFMADNKIQGIGTEATRAGIIETLIARNYVVREQKNIISTGRGRWLIKTLPVDDIKSASLTAKTEQHLKQISEGSYSSSSFLDDVYRDVTVWCNAIGTISKEDTKPMINNKVLKGKCPECGGLVKIVPWGYCCEGYKESCGFAVGKVGGSVLPEVQMEKMLSSGESDLIKDLLSQKGTRFDAYVYIQKDENGHVSTKLRYPDNKVNGVICPDCGKSLVKYTWGYGCSGYRDGCRFSIGKIAGKTLSESQVKKLLETGSVGPISGFKGKNGDFESKLVLVEIDGVHKVDFCRKEPPSNEKYRELYAMCPDCHVRIVKGIYGWECENKCGVEVPYVYWEREMEPEMAEILLSGRSTPLLEGFVSKKKGTTFPAILSLENKKVRFYFPERE